MEDQRSDIRFHRHSHGRSLAFRKQAGRAPTLVFLPGYASDMDGAKATALARFAGERGVGMLRFDYSGTGSSPGRFADGTLEAWLEDALGLIDSQTDGPLILVGSSMGGWIALLAALRRPDRIAGLVGIAAAPDFTDWGYGPGDRDVLLSVGRLERPNPYGGEPQLTTAAFWESGQRLRLLHQPIGIHCPVRLVHGECDEDVPLDVAVDLLGKLRSADAQLLVIKGGGHRLSEPHEVDAMLGVVGGLVEKTQ